MVTVYLTYIYDGVEEDTESYEFNNQEDYDWFAGNHFRSCSTTTPEIYETMDQFDKELIQCLWEEIEG